MAEENVKQQDGIEQEPQAGAKQPGTDPAKNEAQAERAFTQEEVNRMVAERLQRERSKYGDYDDLKKAAARLKEIEDANKTEAEKVKERVEALQREKQELADQNARLASERAETLKRLSVAAEANRVGFVDPDDAWALLDKSTVKIDDEGKVTGAAEAIKALATAKPHLLRKQPQMAATNPGHGGAQSGETDAERRSRLFGTGGVPFGTLGGGSRHQT